MRGVRDDRRQHWAAWAEDARSIYHTRHLPFIVCAYRSVWDIDIDPKMTPMDVPMSVLDHCRMEIIQMMVGMFLLPQSALDNVAERRSRRNLSAVSEGESDDGDTTAAAASNKRARTRSPLVEDVDEDEDDESDDESVTEPGLPLGAEFQSDVIAKLFQLGALRQLWVSGPLPPA